MRLTYSQTMSQRPEITFPDGFLWGSAASAYQIEGAVKQDGRGRSIWDDFVRIPGKVVTGDTGDVACDHYNNVEADVCLMAELGMQTYRFSIAWPRVIPDGRGRVNRDGVSFYSRLVDALLANNVVPSPTLFHWDLPSTLEDDGGFRNRDTASWFADYAALMADELGDRVKMWSTFNEPWCFAYFGHAAGIHAPGISDPRAAVTVAHHQLLAHGLAVQAMRATRSDLNLGIVINPTNIRSEGSPPAPEDGVRLVDGIHNRWWFDSILAGKYPTDVMESFGSLAACVEEGDEKIINQPIDWIGINYYFDMLLKAADKATARGMRTYPTTTNVTRADMRSIHTDMGWPITPEGFTDLLVRLHNDYPNLPPVYITENGCAYDDPIINGTCDDQRRVEYIDLHLRAVKDAIDEGVDVRGFFYWSFMDNFEWALGYEKRFGLVHVDFATLERTPRESASWYREVIRSNSLPAR